MIKISVIIPVYNVEKYIDRCMDSILNQTLKDIEIILIDDGSLDSSGKRCDYYASKDSRVKVIHKENNGLGKARNSGIDIANGKYISFIDSDDFIEKDMLEKLYLLAEENNADTCYCAYAKYEDDKNITLCNEMKEKKVFKEENAKDEFLPLMLGALPDHKKDFEISMCVWRAIYSNEIISNNNLRFCSEREFISEDILFHIDYLYHSKCVVYTPYIGYYYCKNGESLTGKYKKDRFECDVKLYIEICKRLKDKNILNKNRIRVDRLLIGRSRTAIRQELATDLPRNIKNNNIQRIIMNTTLQDILKEYEIYKMPIKHILYGLALKYRSVYAMRLLMFKF